MADLIMLALVLFVAGIIMLICAADINIDVQESNICIWYWWGNKRKVFVIYRKDKFKNY